MSKQQSDVELLERISNGDRTALKLIYDQYSQPISHFVRSWLSDPFDASDIMQETMLEVWRSAGKFAGRSSVKTWIYSIARNKAIDRNRKASRQINQEADVELPDDTPDPEAVTGAFQDAARVRECIKRLSPDHQSAIHLAFFEDLTYNEIAELENCPVGTIKTRIMHAKKLLMRCLSD